MYEIKQKKRHNNLPLRKNAIPLHRIWKRVGRYALLVQGNQVKDLSCSCSCNHIILHAIDVTEGKAPYALHIREDGMEEWKPEYLPDLSIATINPQDRGLSQRQQEKTLMVDKN